jgi:hypothetical protein
MTVTSLHQHADAQKARDAWSCCSPHFKQIYSRRLDNTNMMHPLAAFTAIAAMIAVRPTSATVLPLPRLSSKLSDPTPLLTTKIIYQQGLHSMSDMNASPGICDARIVATGEMRVGWCETLTTSAISISRIEGMVCVLKLFRGSAMCGVDAMEIVSEPDGGNVEKSFNPLLTTTMSRRWTTKSPAARVRSALSLEWWMGGNSRWHPRTWPAVDETVETRMGLRVLRVVMVP